MSWMPSPVQEAGGLQEAEASLDEEFCPRERSEKITTTRITTRMTTVVITVVRKSRVSENSLTFLTKKNGSEYVEKNTIAHSK